MPEMKKSYQLNLIQTLWSMQTVAINPNIANLGHPRNLFLIDEISLIKPRE